jgi:WD40 repeat protein/serine/threonine protein kinase
LALSNDHTCALGHRWQRLPACPVCGAAPDNSEQADSATLPADALPPAIPAISNVTLRAPETTNAALSAELPQVAGYETLRVLGRGGMGVVYLAWQTGLARLVALKTVLAGAHAGPEERARFRTEAEAAARLVHPHIVQIYEIGEADRQPFLALEYVEGGSLAAWLNGQPQPARAAAEFVSTLAEAVHYAHQRGIIHRDLKPANILLGPKTHEPGIRETGPSCLDLRRFDPKITDFGLAKLLVGGASQTASGAILGTPAYMAPEQAGSASEPVGPAADVHSLGAILYELLTGRPPYQAPSVLETLEQVRRQEPVAPRHLVAAIPRDLETICLKCLHKEPARRYESALALAEDLRRYQAGKPVRARPVSAWERGLRWCRRHPAWAALLLVSCLAALALTGTVVGQFYNNQLQSLNADLEGALGQAKVSHDALKQLESQVSYERDIHLADEAWHNGHFERVRKLLEGCPQDLRGWEWHYLKGQAKDGDFLQHKSAFLAVAFHPDNRHLAAGSSDGLVWFWDTLTKKKPLFGQERHPGGVWSVAFSPDGRLLASAGEDRLVRLWNPDDGRLLGKLSGHRLAVRCVAFNPTGTILASAGKDGTVWLWDPRQERERRKLPGAHKGGILALAFAPDGRSLASGGADRMVRLWDPDTGVEMRSLAGHTRDVYGLAFSPDGQTLASADADGTLRTWDPASGLPGTVYLSGNRTAINAVAFGPGGRIATAGDDHHVRLWEGLQVRTFRGHIHQVQGVAFSPDGSTMASASRDGYVKLWKTESSQEHRAFPRGDSAILGAQFSPNGRLTDVSENGTIRTWDVKSGKLLQQRSAGLGRPRFITFQSDGQLLAAAGRDGMVWRWDLAKDQAISGGWKHNATARAVAFSPDGRRLASSGDDKTVRIGDTAGERAPLTCPVEAVPIHAVAFSSDGKTVISGGEDDIRLLDADTGEELPPLPDRMPKATAFAFGPNGLLAVAQMGGRLTLWNFPARRRLGALVGHSAVVWSLAFTPDGTRLASASRDMTVRLWDTASRKEVLPLQGFAAEVLGIAFSPDGRRLVTTDQAGFVKIWEIVGYD